jgi:predicted porin
VGSKAVTVLLGALLCASDAVAGDELQWYGSVNMDIERVSAMGSRAASATSGPGVYDKPARSRISSDSSYLGIRGTRKVREGTDAYFQIESGLNQDTGTATTDTSTNTGISGTFASRNSALGLQGNLGNLFLGTWETPYRTAFNVLDPFGYTGIGGFAILGHGHTTNPNAGNLVSFGRRQNNSLQYWSPVVDGFTAKLAYSPNEERPASGTITATTPAGYNPSLVSLSITYASQLLYGYLGYERHNDYTSVGNYDYAVNAGGSLTMGALKVGVLGEQIRYRFGGAAQNVAPLDNPFVIADAVAAGATGELTLSSWAVFSQYAVGPNGHLRAVYEHASDATGSALTTGALTGATKLTLGYGYTLSPQTEAYVVYTRINNSANGTYDFTTNQIGTGPTGGGDPRGIGVGMSYDF